MLLNKIKVVTCGLRVLAGLGVLAVITVGAQGPAYAQRGARPGVPSPETRGILKSIDLASGKITVTTGPGRGEQSMDVVLDLAKDVEVAIGGGGDRLGLMAFTEGKLADLSPGISVTLTTAADKKTVESIVAAGPTVHGILKGADPTANSVTVTLPPSRAAARGEQPPQPEEKTFTLAKDAEIAVDDGRGRRFSIKEAKLADLVAGSPITLGLTVDHKHVQSVFCEGQMLQGVVKSLDATKNMLTISLGIGRGQKEDRMLELAPKARLVLDDGQGRRLSVRQCKLADVPVGAGVTVRLTHDQKHAAQVRAEGPTLFGQVKAVDLDKSTLVLSLPPSVRGENGEEKILTVDKNARVTIDGAVSKLADLKPEERGPFVMVKLSLDQKVVRGIQAGTGRRR